MTPINRETTTAGTASVSGRGAAPVDALVTSSDSKAGKSGLNWLGWRVLPREVMGADIEDVHRALVCADRGCRGCLMWLGGHDSRHRGNSHCFHSPGGK